MLSPTTLFALDVAREAADLVMTILPASRADKEVRHKSATDLVTRADHEAERLIAGRIRTRFPDHDVLGEEGGAAWGSARSAGGLAVAAPRGEDRPRWIIDPLDGTANFAHGLPWFGISIALEERGAVQAGVVAVPPLGEFFVAGRGRGAFQVGKDGTLIRLNPSKTADLGAALVATGLPREPERSRHVPTIAPVMLRALEVRIMGAAAVHLAYVAAGRLDAFWEPGLAPWDLAAGLLLVEEAGGRISDWRGRPLQRLGGEVLVSNGPLHQAMVDLLRR
ncbi:MAG: inositol monophosphatase family protein [Armatimonadota bacterium]|nr:inositol monophosphatase family protein [Armatimonadota bacterium]MDR7520468.1 inositol monophosphatase family protein [Armatimonadota bacterium]MDR7548514.1 inositol monophosphatase family protein [Armatimonadota bacterium]